MVPVAKVQDWGFDYAPAYISFNPVGEAPDIIFGDFPTSVVGASDSSGFLEHVLSDLQARNEAFSHSCNASWNPLETSVFPGYYLQQGSAMEVQEHSGRRKMRSGKRHGQAKSTLILAESLRSLEGKDPDRIIHARKVQKLGLQSASILRRHYEQYGPVEDVLLSNAHSKAVHAPTRVRASGIALIVMADKNDVTKVLADGDTQVVNGHPISVRRFEHRPEYGSENPEPQVTQAFNKEENVVSDGGSTACGRPKMTNEFMENSSDGEEYSTSWIGL